MPSTGITTTHNRQHTGSSGMSRQSLRMALLTLAMLLLLPGVALAQQGALVADAHTNPGAPESTGSVLRARFYECWSS